MTEEKFNEIRLLKEQIDKIQRELSTIDNLLKSNNLTIEVSGVSNCKFNVKRYLKINNEDYIKSILDSERKDLKFRLSELETKFRYL